MSLTARIFERFRRFPFWSQALITLGSAGILVVLWSACGLTPPPPHSAPPALSAPRSELSGDFGAVFSLAFSPTSEWLAAGTEDKQIHLFDVSRDEVLRTMNGHIQIVKGLAFSPNGRVLASASLDKTIKLWDTFTGKEIRTLSGHSERRIRRRFQSRRSKSRLLQLGRFCHHLGRPLRQSAPEALRAY